MPYKHGPNGEEVIPNPFLEKRPRRRPSAEYTRRILEQAHACGARGERAARLRREGLYASQLSGGCQACCRVSDEVTLPC